MNEQKKGQKWTAADDQYLFTHVGHVSINEIAKKMGRSCAAVNYRMHLHKLDREKVFARTNGMSTGMVAEALGVPFKTVQDWVGSGRLKTTRYPWGNDHHSFHSISFVQLLQFLYEWGSLSPKLNPTAAWRSVVAAARKHLLSLYIDRKDLAALLSVTVDTLEERLKNQQLKPSFYTSSRKCYYYRADVRAWLDAHPEYWTKQAREKL